MYYGHMLDNGPKNIKDTHSIQSHGGTGVSTPLSYTKHKELTTALFMVTDILDANEPLRLKLRTLGVNILSDIYNEPLNIRTKINELVSFIEVAVAVNIISNMNGSILVREFRKLGEALDAYINTKSSWLPDLLAESSPTDNKDVMLPEKDLFVVDMRSRTSLPPTRLGVQKASTLMSAIKDISTNKTASQKIMSFKEKSTDYDLLKKQRRFDISRILKSNKIGLTIKDIITKAKAEPDKFNVLNNCGEKTLQRELVAMVRDGVLEKVGDKRWSKYTLKLGLHFG